jgi:acetylornithine/N-succinyldiaminopimelate aminotransferase
MFCFEHAGIRPDVMTLGKGIGSGVPLAALLARDEFCLFEPGDQGGTYNGNPLMTAVGCAVIEEVSNPEFLARVRNHSEFLISGLQEISRRFHLAEVRGMGFLVALELGAPTATRIVETALSRGLLINSPRPNVLRFMPALNVTRGEIEEMFRILSESITSSESSETIPLP